MNTAQVGFGTVRHTRLRPVRHSFDYPTFFVRLPLRSLRAVPAAQQPLARNRRAVIAFHDADHGDGRADALEWLDELLQEHGIRDADGEAWLHCFPRVFGAAFKPVSFWYCHRTDGTLRAIVAEVNNTFGERHCYVLDAPVWGREISAPKAFYVSPFCRVEGQYRFRFLLDAGGTRTIARVDHDDADGPLLQTSISGTLEAATRRSLARAAWRFPFLAAGILARIHWQALRLWLARVPFHPHRRAPHPVHTRR